MNKKFSTLLASFLLAGGMTTANATVITDADVVAGGQYYYLEQVAALTGTTWAETFKANDQSGENFVIAYDYELKQCVLTAREDGNYANYWRVVKRTVNGVEYYQLISANGNTFSVKLGETTINAFDIPSRKFTLDNGEEADVNGLSFTIKGKTYYLTAGEKLADGVFAIKAIDTANGARGFDFTYAPGTAYSSSYLNQYNGKDAGFSLGIGFLNSENNDKWEAYSDLQANVFGTTLKASVSADKDYSSKIPAISGDGYYLKSGNNYLVLTTTAWSEFNINPTGENNFGLAFTTMSASDLATQLEKDQNGVDKAAPKIKAIKFQISSNVNDGGYVEVAALDADNKAVGELYVFNFNGKQYLTVKDAQTLKDADYNTEDGKTYVKLGNWNNFDWSKFATAPAYYSFVNKKTGEVLGVTGCSGEMKSAWLPATEVQSNMPEGLWAMPKAGLFVNREAEVVYNMNGYRWEVVDASKNLYKIEGVEIYVTPYTLDKVEEGYGAFATKDAKYNLGVYSPVWKGTAYFAENHADSHQIGLDTNIENASVWTLVANTNTQKVNTIYGNMYQGTDSLYVKHDLYWYGTLNGVKGWHTTTDTLKAVTYKVKNANGEYITYDNSEGVYTCSESEAVNFVFKKVGDTYNMIVVDLPVNASKTSSQETSAPNAKFVWTKVYGGDSATDGLLAQTCAYERTENDLISVTAIDAPEYLKLNMGDVIKIFRSEYADEQSNVLYEKGKFLGVGNAVEFAGINPALYVDTAYTDSYRPEYLLAVDVEQVLMEESCEIPGHPHAEADTLFGRFLVSFADSAIVETNIHANEWLYDGEAKLGFVEGFHTANNLELPATKAKIGVRTSDPKFGKYAFRIVDNSTDAFVIETAHKVIEVGGKVTTGYIRIVNGNVVVTTDINEAEVFNLTATDQTPTANETIAASAVTVVAGEGNVTIAGAAGKKVVIANILGQTIANTVLTSDNATIAAPAGVVVVAVEGEAAVKAIVK